MEKLDELSEKERNGLGILERESLKVIVRYANEIQSMKNSMKSEEKLG